MVCTFVWTCFILVALDDLEFATCLDSFGSVGFMVLGANLFCCFPMFRWRPYADGFGL